MIINMTPHDVHMVDESGNLYHTFKKSGDEIRLSVKTVKGGSIDGFPTTLTKFGEVVGLPDFEKTRYYIVSQLVKNALPERTDLLVPAEVVRDSAGVIIGCKSLGR